ncbi:MAG: hypothetical protein ACUVX9_01760 [Anaerolineae bacterium]
MPIAHDEYSPATVEHPTPALQVIRDITAQPGVMTPEGLYGPLLIGSTMHTRFIEFPAGLYCIEHALPVESMVYTVRGRWVLTSEGSRTVMPPQSLAHLPANVPKGFEIPFEEPALLLVLRAEATTAEDIWRFLLEDMQPMLQQRIHAGQLVFQLADLPADHPARLFAAQVNPSRWGGGR